MKRRKFVKKLIKAGGIFSTVLFFNTKKFVKKLFSNQTPSLVAVKGTDHKKNLKTAIELLGGIEKFIKKGDKVVIKPNIAWNRPPEMAANTNPELVGTMVELCKQAGAKEILVFDRTCNRCRDSYKRSGIKEAAEKAGAKVKYIGDKKISEKLFQKVKIPKGKYLKESLVCKYILEADKVINMPVAKVHSRSVLTIALKNWMGITGDKRNKVFHPDLHNAIADFATIVNPVLTVVDGTRIMVDKGPTGGKLEYVRKKDLVIVSPDQLLADVYAAKKLFNKTPKDVDFLEFAYKHGIGEKNLKKANIIEKSV